MDILYTDTDQIRGALMLAPEDLPDNLFNQDLLERELLLSFDEWLPTHSTIIANNTTAEARRLAALVRSYTTYWCAYRALITFVVALPQQVSDGKNMRQIGSDLTGLREAIAGSMLAAQKTILLALGSTAAASSIAQLTLVDSALDPVTYDGA